MAGVIPNVEEERIITNYVIGSLAVKLFSNNVTPSETSTIASFTECSGGGYAVLHLDPEDW